MRCTWSMQQALSVVHGLMVCGGGMQGGGREGGADAVPSQATWSPTMSAKASVEISGKRRSGWGCSSSGMSWRNGHPRSLLEVRGPSGQVGVQA